MNCPSEDTYTSKDGRCCDRCHAGTYVQADCDGTKKTECVGCGRGLYTATKNHLNKCQKCKECSRNNNQRKVRDCTAEEDTVCECVEGFYCNTDNCEHCRSVTHCPPGTGVKDKANRMIDTICAPCKEGTYSNVSDFHSPCQAHTRCEDFGRMLISPGTPTTDVICGNFKSYCSWILPAGLWSGFVLTVLIVFGLIFFMAKRKSHRAGVTASSRVPVTLVEISAAPIGPLELPLKPTELNDHLQKSCAVEACKLTLFNPDDNDICCSTEDSVDSSFPITPLKVSVSFAESSHINGSAGYCTGNFLRTYSEPQEDEWCGT